MASAIHITSAVEIWHSRLGHAATKSKIQPMETEKILSDLNTVTWSVSRA